MDNYLPPGTRRAATRRRWPWWRQAGWTFGRSSPTGSRWHRWKRPSAQPRKAPPSRWWSACNRKNPPPSPSKQSSDIFFAKSFFIQTFRIRWHEEEFGVTVYRCILKFVCCCWSKMQRRGAGYAYRLKAKRIWQMCTLLTKFQKHAADVIKQIFNILQNYERKTAKKVNLATWKDERYRIWKDMKETGHKVRTDMSWLENTMQTMAK